MGDFKGAEAPLGEGGVAKTAQRVEPRGKAFPLIIQKPDTCYHLDTFPKSVYIITIYRNTQRNLK